MLERAGVPARSTVAFVAVAIGVVAIGRMATAIDYATSADADVFLWAVELAGALTAAAFGAVLVHRGTATPAGWLLQLAAVGLAVSALTDSGPVLATAWQPFGDTTATVQLWATLFGRVLLLAAGVVSLPDHVAAGRAGNGAFTAVVASLAVATTAGLLLHARPESLRATNVGFGNRAWVDAAAAVPPGALAAVLAVHSLVLVVLARRRGGEPTSFQVVGWGLAAAALPSALPPIADRLPVVMNEALVTLTWPVLPVVSVIAALRALAWTVSRLVSRTLVWALLSLGVLVLQSAAVGVAAIAGGRLGLATAVAVTFAVAIGFQSTQRWLRTALDRVLYGVDRDPSAALADLGERLQQAVGPDDLLADVASAIASAFGGGVVIELTTPEGPVEVARAGVFDGRGTAHDWPLVHQGERIGRLVAQSPAAAPFRSADLAALGSLAPQAGIVAYSVRVARELRRSQELLVAAVEDERRRLQHDLHDGLGPALAGVALGLRAARNQLRDGAADPEPLLELLTGELEASVEEVRRIVHGLRPAVLDQLGLVAAIRAYADRATSPTLAVHVEVQGDLPLLPAAVEVAAYRIAVEALTNVVRHAGATTCTVVLRAADGHEGGLQVEVVDDGVGIGDGVTPGVGLASMRERTSGVGGRLLISVGRHGGTRVVAELPTGARSA